jgi:hypothetical protein
MLPGNSAHFGGHVTSGPLPLHALSRSANSVLPSASRSDLRDSTSHLPSTNHQHMHPARVVWDQLHSLPSQRTASTELLNQYLGNYYPADVQQASAHPLAHFTSTRH